MTTIEIHFSKRRSLAIYPNLSDLFIHNKLFIIINIILYQSINSDIVLYDLVTKDKEWHVSLHEDIFISHLRCWPSNTEGEFWNDVGDDIIEGDDGIGYQEVDGD